MRPTDVFAMQQLSEVKNIHRTHLSNAKLQKHSAVNRRPYLGNQALPPSPEADSVLSVPRKWNSTMWAPGPPTMCEEGTNAWPGTEKNENHANWPPSPDY